MISFIIPAKDASEYIEEAISPILSQNIISDWELVVVNDHSTDDTVSKIEDLASGDSRIRIIQNPGSGKVQALNFGFSKSKGDYIKCIDSDDILDEDFFSFYSNNNSYDAHMHDAYIVDDELQKMGVYHMQSAVNSGSYDEVLDNLVSIPRWSWTVNRELATKVFPMPDDLPFEDVWFTMLIKKNAANIIHTGKPLYHYRQHQGQTFGGILNYSKEVLNFRAARMLKLIQKFKEHKDRLGIDSVHTLENMEDYYNLLQGDFKLSEILKSRQSISKKLKLILICFFPSFAKFATKVKWKFDRFLSNSNQ